MKEYTDYPILKYNTFGMDVKASRFVEYSSVGELKSFLASRDVASPLLHIGGGSNLLFLSDFKGTILHSAIKGFCIEGESDEWIDIKAGAGEVWDDFVAYTVSEGWYGAENLSIIPGEVGASAVQNIGAYGAEAAGIIYRVHLYDTLRREHATLEKADCRFAYRDSIFKHEMRGRTVITAVELRLGKHPSPNLAYGDLKAQVEARGGASIANIRNAVCAIRRSKLPDPDTLGNAGSFFKNPVVDNATAERLREEDPACPVYPVSAHGMCKLAAGWLIDRAGLKGFRMGRVGVHERQALVLVNFGGATGNEVIALARYVQQRVFDSFGVRIEPEVNIL